MQIHTLYLVRPFAPDSEDCCITFEATLFSALRPGGPSAEAQQEGTKSQFDICLLGVASSHPTFLLEVFTPELTSDILNYW